MTRGLSSTNEAAVVASPVRDRYFAELDFSGGLVRVWSGVGNFSTLSRTFTGLGDLCGISPITESKDRTSRKVALSLNGVPSEQVARVLSEDFRLRPVKLWCGLMAADGATLLDDPFIIFAGRMSACVIEDDPPTAKITVTAESHLNEIRRARTARYSDEEQKKRFAGDRGLEFVSRLAERPIYWGGPGPAASPGYGG